MVAMVGGDEDEEVTHVSPLKERVSRGGGRRGVCDSDEPERIHYGCWGIQTHKEEGGEVEQRGRKIERYDTGGGDLKETDDLKTRSSVN